MRIEKHISALLYRYQCVTVPGFGAFLAEVRPAVADNATNTFYPPKKAVSFNANVKNNDGLLANHIALQEKISYSEAVTLINTAVTTWKQQLDNLDVITLKNIGDFGLNAEGSLVFSPADNTNYLATAFGLASVVSHQVKREVLKAEVEELEEKAPIIFTPERKRSYSYLKYAAVFAVVAGVGGTALVNYRNAQIAQQTLAVEKAVQQKVQQRIQEATFFIETPLPAVTMPVDETLPANLHYHIIAGAFKSEENADKAVAELKTKGFKSQRLAPTKYGLYPVTYNSFATRQEANAGMKELHKTTDPGAWVLTIE
ncbi:sporulation protein [Flavobacterium akiainvivens]|uniref:Sporulation protein n=1 Tax=Flavobacterium akiainvivens TaxID=1202724 RepID=A0A0M9VK11_9FLAO|nr:SPOR domain-containing protein [Flavobacterium akiainvivens]KOS08366.1 sporulation protein [Flavobacterium akiainvivens]